VQSQAVSPKVETDIQQMHPVIYCMCAMSAKCHAGKSHWLSSEVICHGTVWSWAGRQTLLNLNRDLEVTIHL